MGTDFSYYPVSRRLKDAVTKLANQTQIQNLLNGYDQAGNITKITDSIAAHTGSASASITGTVYDDLNRLTSATWSGYGTKTYSYDAIGNTLVNGEAGAGTYDYGTARPQAVKSANGKDYTYDLNGNMRLRGTQQLEYDVYNHLIKVRPVLGNITEFGYAGGGERLWKTSGGQLKQVWIGGHYEEKDGKVLYHVMAAGRRICTFEAAAAGASGYNPALHEFYYYHPDHLGSSSVMTERNGTEVQHYEYSAYGRDRYTSTATPPAFPVSHRFTGQILDADTGLYYYGARYYDPELGRFIQPDTIIPDFGNPQSYNRYAYCLNNPLKYADPDGHDPKEILDSMVYFAGGVFSGAVNVWNPIPIQVRGEGPPPSTMAEYYGRRTGEAIGVGVSMAEIYFGIEGVIVGGTIVGASVVAEGASGGVATPVALPAVVVGGVIVAGGAVATTHGVIGVNNYVFSKTEKPKTHQTYTKEDPVTGEVYSGKTSGTGTPEQNVARMDSGHHMNKKGFGPAKLDKSSSNADAIRGREQQSIEANGGAKSQGGTSGNQNNSIGPRNEKADVYKKAAEDEFGKP